MNVPGTDQVHRNQGATLIGNEHPQYGQQLKKSFKFLLGKVGVTKLRCLVTTGMFLFKKQKKSSKRNVPVVTKERWGAALSLGHSVKLSQTW